VEQSTDGAETSAIDGLVSSWSENIFVSFCLRAPRYGLTLWCALGLLLGEQYKCLSYSYSSIIPQPQQTDSYQILAKQNNVRHSYCDLNTSKLSAVDYLGSLLPRYVLDFWYNIALFWNQSDSKATKVEYQGQILKFLTAAVKCRGGVDETSEWVFFVRDLHVESNRDLGETKLVVSMTGSPDRDNWFTSSILTTVGVISYNHIIQSMTVSRHYYYRPPTKQRGILCRFDGALLDRPGD